MNATLHCFTYTPPLVNYLLGDNHFLHCKVTGFCMLCALQHHMDACFHQSPNQPVKPFHMLNNLQVIAKGMRCGQQEDAHEFLMHVLSKMEDSCLFGKESLDVYSKHTTVVGQIFGGYLRNQLNCHSCKERRNTFDPFMDINLGMSNVHSVESAMQRFIKPDNLDGYRCWNCQQTGSVTKRLTIHTPPNVLTVQLNRFSAFGSKITGNVTFTENLNIRLYTTQFSRKDHIIYSLHAVIVHSGQTSTSGHYYAFVKAPNGTWHLMNDSRAVPVSLATVLAADAYVLFYTRTLSPSAKQPSPPSTSVHLHTTQHPDQKRPQQQKSTAPLRDNVAANDDTTTTPHAGQWIKVGEKKTTQKRGGH